VGCACASLSAQVRRLELVLANGSVATCSPTDHADLFRAAAVGLGAFGVIVAITFGIEPAFLLTAREEPMPLETVLEEFDALAADNGGSRSPSRSGWRRLTTSGCQPPTSVTRLRRRRLLRPDTIRGLFRRRRGDRGCLRGAAALGKAAQPKRRRPGGRISPLGRRAAGAGRGGPRPSLRQRLPSPGLGVLRSATRRERLGWRRTSTAAPGRR
jgi:hypothetical protein